MTNFRSLHGLLLLGFGVMALSCGPAPESLEPTGATLPPTSTVAGSSVSPAPATVTPMPAIPEVLDRTCPPMTGGAPPIQLHPDSTDYSQEIADYLSAGGSLEELLSELEFLGELSWEKKVAVLSVDVTGDGQLDVVVESLWIPPEQTLSGHAYVLTCAAGRFVATVVADFGFTASFANPSQNQTLGLRAVEDLTGDGVPELLISFVETPEMLPVDGQSDYVRFFKVVGWDGTEFADLLPEQFPTRPAVTVRNGDGTLSDADGDSLKELVLRGGAAIPGYGHPFLRAQTETWGWEDPDFALRCIVHGAPTYRFQAVEDGDAAVLCRDWDVAIDSYQRAIFDESLRTWVGDELGLVPAPEDERLVLSAYSRYRILLIHLANGTDDAASVVHEGLQKNFPTGSAGSAYAELAEVVWDEYSASQDLSAACRKAVRQAEAEGLAPLADLYGYFSKLYSADDYLCPF